MYHSTESSRTVTMAYDPFRSSINLVSLFPGKGPSMKLADALMYRTRHDIGPINDDLLGDSYRDPCPWSSSMSDPHLPFTAPQHQFQSSKRSYDAIAAHVPYCADIAPPKKARASEFQQGDVPEFLSVGLLNPFQQVQPDEKFCALCKRNGEARTFYTTHVLKDNRGKVVCPILRKYVCPKCGASGDNAHTIKYCPHNKSVNHRPAN